MSSSAVAGVRQTVARFLTRVAMPPHALILAAVSGGQDSVCLLDALATEHVARGGQIAVGHIDHGLRAESAADADFVAALARKAGHPFVSLRIDVPHYRTSHRLGLEEAARGARYQALAAVAARVGALAVATGHTQSDAAETLLINIMRGTGLTGTTSIQPDTTLSPDLLAPRPSELMSLPDSSGPLRVIRPLLDVTRETTAAYCREHGLEFRLDPSNADREIHRNRVRHHLLPLLATYNPAIVASLARLARLATEDEGELERLTDADWKSHARVSVGQVAFGWEAWSAMSDAIQRRLLRRAAGELAVVGGLSFASIESARALLFERRADRRLALAGGLQLATSRTGFRLSRGQQHDA